jgi:hypothetical protein
MRKLSELKKIFYIKRFWADGDIDYFKVISTDKSNNHYLTDNDYIRFSGITNDYTSLGNISRTVFIDDFRVKDEIMSKLEYTLIKEKVTEEIWVQL